MSLRRLERNWFLERRNQRKNTFAIDRTVGGIQRRPSKIKFISSYRERKEYSEAEQRFGHHAKIRLSYVRKAITLRPYERRDRDNI